MQMCDKSVLCSIKAVYGDTTVGKGPHGNDKVVWNPWSKTTMCVLKAAMSKPHPTIGVYLGVKI